MSRYRNSRERASAPFLDLREENHDTDEDGHGRYYHLLKGNISVTDIWGGGDDAAPDTTIHKSKESIPPMTPTEQLRSIVKRYGIGAVAGQIVNDDHAFGITEAEFTELVTEAAKRDGMTDAQAFEQLFTDQSDAGIILRKAYYVVRNSGLEIENLDAVEAYHELEVLGKRDYPNLTPAQRFAKAFESHPDLAARAHVRPGPSTSFAHPPSITKAMPLTNTRVSVQPLVSDNANVDSPEKALAQLRIIGRRRWPSVPEAESFLRAVTDAENADLVNLALSTPKGSTPPRE